MTTSVRSTPTQLNKVPFDVEFAPGAAMSSPVQRSAEAVVSWLLSPLDSHGHSLQSERGNIAEHARDGPYLPNASGTSK